MNPPSTPRRKRFVAIAIIALVFILGIITGLAGGAMVLRHRVRQSMMFPNKQPGAGDLFIDRLEKEIDSGLKLNADEKALVRSELNITRERLHEIRDRTLADVRTTARDTIDRIKTKLPAEKRDELESKARDRLAPWGLLGE